MQKNRKSQFLEIDVYVIITKLDHSRTEILGIVPFGNASKWAFLRIFTVAFVRLF